MIVYYSIHVSTIMELKANRKIGNCDIRCACGRGGYSYLGGDNGGSNRVTPRDFTKTRKSMSRMPAAPGL